MQAETAKPGPFEPELAKTSVGKCGIDTYSKNGDTLFLICNYLFICLYAAFLGEGCVFYILWRFLFECHQNQRHRNCYDE